MAKGPLKITNWAAETLIAMPPTGVYNRKGYLFFEGPVAEIPDEGYKAVAPGLALIVYPALVMNKPGGIYFIDWPGQYIISGQCSFAGQLTVEPLSRGRILHVVVNEGDCAFIIETKGKKPHRVPAIIFNKNMKVHTPRKVSDLGSSRVVASWTGAQGGPPSA